MKIFKSKKKCWQDNRGITLFIAVTIMALLLFVSFAVSNIAVKSLLFSSSGRDSQAAFFAADAGIECAIYWDSKWDPSKFDTSANGSPITCGGKIMNAGDPIAGTTTTSLIGGGVGSTQSIALVGSPAVGGNNTGTQSNTISSSSFQADAGNLIVVSIRFRMVNSRTIAPGGVVDSAGNTYTMAEERVSAGNNYLGIWYKANAAPSSSNVVTVTFTGGVDYRNINVLQYSGIALGSPVDATEDEESSGSDNDIESDSFDTDTPDELIIAAAQVANLTTTWSATSDNGYTRRATSPQNVLMTGDRIVSTIQNNERADAENSNSSAAKSIVVATFRAGSTGGSNPTKTSVFGFNMDGGLNPTQSCAIITVTKESTETFIKSRGYNTCGVSPRRIERGLEVTY